MSLLMGSWDIWWLVIVVSTCPVWTINDDNFVKQMIKVTTCIYLSSSIPHHDRNHHHHCHHHCHHHRPSFISYKSKQAMVDDDTMMIIYLIEIYMITWRRWLLQVTKLLSTILHHHDHIIIAIIIMIIITIIMAIIDIIIIIIMS